MGEIDKTPQPETHVMGNLPDEKPDAPVENRPEWLWYCESTSGVPVVTFGRWAKHPQQARYKLADIQPTEHGHPTVKITSEQLRQKAAFAEELGYRDHSNTLLDAAETIEFLEATATKEI